MEATLPGRPLQDATVSYSLLSILPDLLFSMQM